MASVPFDAVKAYCRSKDEDDDLVAILIDAAEEYLHHGGVDLINAPYSLYVLALSGIVLHWYDNREAVDQSSPDDFEPGIRKAIEQLKRLCALVETMGGCSCG